MALTDTSIRNAKAKDKPYKLGDSGGLFLLVQPSGGKLWRFKYRVDGREKKLGLGTYPDHLFSFQYPAASSDVAKNGRKRGFLINSLSPRPRPCTGSHPSVMVF